MIDEARGDYNRCEYCKHYQVVETRTVFPKIPGTLIDLPGAGAELIGVMGCIQPESPARSTWVGDMTARRDQDEGWSCQFWEGRFSDVTPLKWDPDLLQRLGIKEP